MHDRTTTHRRAVASLAVVILAFAAAACGPTTAASTPLPAAPVRPAATAAGRPEPDPDLGRTVLLVHGYHGSPSAFDRLQDHLAGAGIPSIVVALPGDDNLENAETLRQVVEQEVRQRGPGTMVDIVAHSMGGLSSRWYAKFLGGSPAAGPPILANLVALGTPQYGLPATCRLVPENGGQMCPTSPFLTQLNDGDDTPGATIYTSITSSDDGLVPAASARLDGGACVVEVKGIGHFDLRTDPVVLDLVVRVLRGSCPGVVRTLPEE